MQKNKMSRALIIIASSIFMGVLMGLITHDVMIGIWVAVVSPFFMLAILLLKKTTNL